jgi:hypothetical protein
MKLEKSVNLLTAETQLKTATTIEEWNSIRSKASLRLSKEELCEIDMSGLIIEVLGSDPR